MRPSSVRRPSVVRRPSSTLKSLKFTVESFWNFEQKYLKIIREVVFFRFSIFALFSKWPPFSTKNARFGTWRPFSQNLFSNFFLNLCYGLLMVTFDKPISFVALESLEVSHFRPERLITRQKCAFFVRIKIFKVYNWIFLKFLTKILKNNIRRVFSPFFDFRIIFKMAAVFDVKRAILGFGGRLLKICSVTFS